jgi:hypothetical protein
MVNLLIARSESTPAVRAFLPPHKAHNVHYTGTGSIVSGVTDQIVVGNEFAAVLALQIIRRRRIVRARLAAELPLLFSLRHLVIFGTLGTYKELARRIRFY